MDKIIWKLHVEANKLGKDKQMRDDYEKLETDHERLIFTFKIMLEYNLIPTATGIQKNAGESEKLRKEGDALFSQVPLDNIMCIKALELYTKSIAFAPYSSEQLAITYANRSAVLHRLGLHLECIQDIDRALASNFPDNLKAMIYIRRTECSIILERSSVQRVIKEAQHWLEMMSLTEENRKKFRKELDTLCHKINVVAQVEPKEREIDAIPTIIESYSNEIPCASDAVTLKYDKDYGRHVVATRDIRPGELLAIEKPYSLLISSQQIYTHCSNCLKLCWSNIPCDHCVYAMYCSEKCKDIAWRKYHDVECAVLPALIEYGRIVYHPFSLKLAILAVREAGSITELETMLGEIDKCDDPRTKGFSQDGKFYSDKYISLYSLVTNSEKRTVTDLFGRSLDACVVLYFFATKTMFFGTKLPEDINALMRNNDAIFFARLIFRHEQAINCNAIKFIETYDSEVTFRGLATMPFFSLINHSCDPNVLWNSRSADMMLHAVYPIKKGDQIFSNYGQHYAFVPKTIRQQFLLKHYHFICDCIPCQANWACRTQLESFQNLVKEANDELKIRKALEKLDMYLNVPIKNEILGKSDVVKNLLMAIQVLHDYVPMPCEEMIRAVDILSKIILWRFAKVKIPQLWPYEK